MKDADTGERRKPGMPSGRLVELVAWDGPDTVVLQVRNPYGEDPPGGQAVGLVALVGCDVLTGDCHEVDGSPTGPAELPSVW